MTYTPIDKQELFKKEGAPLLETLRQFCSVNGIPFFFSACVKNNETESTYVNEGNLPGSGGYNLFDDKLSKYLAVTAGFDVIPDRNDLQIQIDAPEWDDD